MTFHMRINFFNELGSKMFDAKIETLLAVSYTHLDVYKRQGYLEDDMVRRWSNLSLTQEVLGELYEGLVQDLSLIHI